jgi:hypothetical protein
MGKQQPAKGGAKGGSKDKGGEKGGSSGGKLGTCKEVKARHILCEKQSKITDVYNKLKEVSLIMKIYSQT